jgi:hypothetical protein
MTINVIQHGDRLRLFYNRAFSNASKNDLDDQNLLLATVCCHVLKIRCDQLKNKSSRRVTCGNPCYSIGSKANSIYFLNDRSVYVLRTEIITYPIKIDLLCKRSK